MYGSVFVQKGRHCSRFRILGGVFVKKLKGDTACDFRFGELICKKAYGGHSLRLRILGSVFVRNLEGDAACDLRFGKCIVPKPYGGTLLAI